MLRRLLRKAGYGLRANLKRLSGKSPPDRDRQFRYLSRLRHLALQKGCPVRSIDTKNKELVGKSADTSKWSWIEHRLFSFISLNWAGEPLRTLNKLLSLIRGTTTRTGLNVTAELDSRDYPKKVKVPNAEFKSIQLQRHNTCPQWYYTITPKNSRK